MRSNKLMLVLVLAVLLIAGYFVYVLLSQKSLTQDAGNQGPVQGKLNIDAVCNSALAYMSFPDGAAAEAFVSECKEGKHPEVIERYKAEMGLGDGAAI